MKKVVILLIISILLVTGCTKKQLKVTKDEQKFKEEYESINGQKQNDKEIMELNVPEENKISYIDSSEVLDIIKNKTGVIYFGFPKCPWCRNLVPVLIDAAEEVELDKIYYANLLDERNTKTKNEDGEIIEEKKGSDNYYKLLELLDDKLGVYEGLDSEEEKRLYFPTVLFVKNGHVEDIHIGTLDSQKDPYKKLTEKQEKELKSILTKAMKKTQSLTCDTDKTC